MQWNINSKPLVTSIGEDFDNYLPPTEMFKAMGPTSDRTKTQKPVRRKKKGMQNDA